MTLIPSRTDASDDTYDTRTSAAVMIAAPMMETLTCMKCSMWFERMRVRRRKQHVCPTCPRELAPNVALL